MPSKSRPYWGLTAIAATGILAMVAASPVDFSWTVAIGRESCPWVEEIMGRSIFEGEGIGVNDPVILLLLAAVAVYYAGWRFPGTKQWTSWRPQAGFILVHAVVAAVYFVHALKWAIGRARPDAVLYKGLAFSHWFTFGPHFITDGAFRGAFPSGHTAQMFILMAVAYILAGDPLLPKSIRRIGLLWAAVALIASLAMGLTRCLTLSHWLTDVIGSIAFGWLIMHLLYFYILRVPEQRQFMLTHAAPPKVPTAWEIVFCIYLLAAVLGSALMVIGLRAMIMESGAWPAWLTPLAAIGIWLAWKRIRALIRTVWQAYGLT